MEQVLKGVLDYNRNISRLLAFVERGALFIFECRFRYYDHMLNLYAKKFKFRSMQGTKTSLLQSVDHFC